MQNFSAQTNFAGPSAFNLGDVSANDDKRALLGGELLNIAYDDAQTLFGIESQSGSTVTHQTAMMLPAFWQAIDMKSGDVAKIPLEIYKRGPNRSRELFTNHAAYRFVRYQANEDQSAFEWRRQMMCHRLVWNNCFSFIQRNGRGDTTGLYPLLPDRTRCKRIDGRLIYESEIGGKLHYFDSSDMFHLKGISFDGELGLDLIKFMRDAFGKILARIKFTSKFFKQGGRVGGILQLEPTRSKTKNDRIEEGFRKTYEGDDAAFKTVILRDNAKFMQAQGSFKDTQLVEVSQEDIRTIARITNTPPHKLGAIGSTSYGSLESENQAYYDNSLSHHFCEFESEAWLKLLQKPTRNSGKVFFEHTIQALLWSDSKNVAEVASKGVLAGWVLRNEARRWFNLNPIPGGDEPLIPSGMTTGGDPDPDDSQDDERSKKLSEPLAQLIDETRSRFIKRLATHTNKQARKLGTDQITDWIEKTLEADHLGHGQRMFDAVQKLETAATGSATDHATEILKRFRGNIAAANRAGQLQETIKGYLS